jgi:type II secretion system protein N
MISRFARGRRTVAALGILLFVLVFLLVLLYSIPGETFLSPLRSSLAGRGMTFTCEEARIFFPLGIRCKNASISRGGGQPVSFDSVSAAWEWTGLFRWLPIHLTGKRGEASIDIRTSPALSDPGKVRVRLSRLGSGDLGSFFPSASGAGFQIDSLDLQWKQAGGGRAAGAGEGSLAWLKLPIPATGSPVQEAVLKDVRLKFVVREGTIHVSSLTGKYEGSDVDGTGEIARFLTPSMSNITFHLRIRNPLEGRVATLFDLVAKNVKNANLRISGTLLSPTGEFQFF